MLTAESPPAGKSVYGLLVHGLDEVDELLPAVTSTAGLTPIEVMVGQLDTPPPVLRALDGDRVVRRLVDGRHLSMSRRQANATFYGPTLEPDLLAHPYLGPVAVTFNRWAGREAYHAGAFIAGTRAWIVVGNRMAGKSTLMAALCAADVPVLADDIVITDGRYVYAGPRTVDLRHAIPESPLVLRQSRLGTRVRVALPPTPDRVEVGGWIFLHWEQATSARPVKPRELLSRVAGRRALPSLPSDPAGVLALAAAPAWDLGRPRDWKALPDSVDLLRDITAASTQLASVS